MVAEVVLVGLKNRCKERPESKLLIPVGQRRHQQSVGVEVHKYHDETKSLDDRITVSLGLSKIVCTSQLECDSASCVS